MSDERERAAYYEAHKDEDDDWGEPIKPSKERRKLASMISVRLSADEVRTVREAAALEGESVSAFIRKAALSAALRDVRDITPVGTIRVAGPSQLTMLAAPMSMDLPSLGYQSIAGIG